VAPSARAYDTTLFVGTSGAGSETEWQSTQAVGCASSFACKAPGDQAVVLRRRLGAEEDEAVAEVVAALERPPVDVAADGVVGVPGDHDDVDRLVPLEVGLGAIAGVGVQNGFLTSPHAAKEVHHVGLARLALNLDLDPIPIFRLELFELRSVDYTSDDFSNFERNSGQSFSFDVLHHKVVAVTGEGFRRVFYSDPRMDFIEGAKLLMGAVRVALAS